ncbi:MAG TPA: hypothetical protein VFX60_12685 [Micromonospora sp.]|nr:hypothetical protein [Micromonospora sp.]
MRRKIAVAAAAAVALCAAAGLTWGPRPSPAVAQVRHVAPTYAPPRVVIDDPVDLEQAEVAREIARIVNDPRGWRTDLDHVTVLIVVPGSYQTDPMPGTIGHAWPEEHLVSISAEAWTTVGPWFAGIGGTLDDQRTWIVLHELGHVLGHKHVANCPGSGPAPVMRPFSYDIGMCDLNVWPNPVT